MGQLQLQLAATDLFPVSWYKGFWDEDVAHAAMAVKIHVRTRAVSCAEPVANSKLVKHA